MAGHWDLHAVVLAPYVSKVCPQVSLLLPLQTIRKSKP